MSGNFADKMYNYIMSEKLIADGDGIVVGLSGGADSVALLLALLEVSDRLSIDRSRIVAVHVNHMIRGEEADADQAFAEKLCERLGVSCRVYKRDVPSFARELGCTLEEAGRICRYRCFNETADKCGLEKIAVAHNQNDLAETLLFNMLRGSGINGLGAIKSSRDNIIRPVLFADRSEIECYLKEKHQDYVTDSSNLTLDYDRNKIRHVILPTMSEINQRAVPHLAELSREAHACYEYIHRQAVDIMERLDESGRSTNTIILDIDALSNQDRLICDHIIYEAVGRAAGVKKDITRKHIALVYELMRSGTGKKINLPYDVVVRVSYDKLIFENPAEERCEFYTEVNGPGEYHLMDMGTLVVSLMDNSGKMELPKKNYTKFFDYDKIMGTLCIRTPKQGDYIKIDDKGKTKKLSRVFIDAKVDRNTRNSLPVIAVDHEVLWAVGIIYNEAYRVDDKTKQILSIQYIGGQENGRKRQGDDK